MPAPTQISGLARIRLLLGLLLFGLAAFGGARTARCADTMTAAVDAALEARAAQETSGAASALYHRRELRPLWLTGAKPSEAARAMISVLLEAEAQGLRSEDYGAADRALQQDTLRITSASPAQLAAFDVDLTREALRYLHDLHFGRVNPRSVGFELDAAREPFDGSALVAQLAAGAESARLVASAAPRFYHYQLLKEALAHYRQLAQQPAIALTRPARPLKLGDSYADAAALRALLSRLGDLPPSDGSAKMIDNALATALAKFQARHGLRASGILDSVTYQALMTPLSKRVRQIELTLERWRWIPEFSRPPIIVNIPQFRLFAFNSLEDRKASMLQMDVIVGRTFSSAHTPVFVADMTSVIFRPFWQVPRGIVKKEVLPRALRNPNYLAGEQLEIVAANDEGSTPLPASPENLKLLASGKLKLRQRPGAQNALGLIKFSLPNPHDVYLHSTPTPALFREPVRAFSHGCIRVSDPISLAVHVLRNNGEEWTAETVSARMHADETSHVKLATSIPVLILYGTALATEDGKILFFNDIYGHDERLAAALNRARR